MRRDGYDEGVPSWVDLSTPDPAAAAGFYGALLGWDAPEGAPEYGGYRVCSLQGATVAGIGVQTDPGPAYWTTYVNTASAAGTAERVVRHGGKVLFGPVEVGDVGHMAIVADPTGAVSGIWQAGTNTGAQLVNVPGAWCWSELMTTDAAAAIDHYSGAYGWTPSVSEQDGALLYCEWVVGGSSVAGMLPQPAWMPPGTPSAWLAYFAVDDTDAALAHAVALGGSELQRQIDIPIGRFAVAQDPAGAAIGLVTLAG